MQAFLNSAVYTFDTIEKLIITQIIIDISPIQNQDQWNKKYSTDAIVCESKDN